MKHYNYLIDDITHSFSTFKSCLSLNLFRVAISFGHRFDDDTLKMVKKCANKAINDMKNKNVNTYTIHLSDRLSVTYKVIKNEK